MCRQYCLILQRSLVQAYRVPVALLALSMMGFFNGLTYGTIFHGVGAKQFSMFDMRSNERVGADILGLAFQVGSDQFIQMSFA